MFEKVMTDQHGDDASVELCVRGTEHGAQAVPREQQLDSDHQREDEVQGHAKQIRQTLRPREY